MFEGRDGPMSAFRGRDGMNMGGGPQDRPPVDVRRFDCPPDVMGRSIGLLDRGRDAPRDFFRPGDDLDMNFRRHFEVEGRNNQHNAPGFLGQGHPPMDMGCRDMQGRNMRGADYQFMDMRERDRFRMDMPGFNMSPMDVRRRGSTEPMDRNDNLRERERAQMGMSDVDRFSLDMPPRERPVMDFERRGFVPSLNPRARFESDIDFRNRMGPLGDFRDRPSPMLRDNDGSPLDVRGRPDMPLDRRGPEKNMLRVGEPTLRDREFPEPAESPGGLREDNKSLSEEWHKQGMRDRDSFSPAINRNASFSREINEPFKPGHGKEGDLGEPSQFKERERPSEFAGKDCGTSGFSRSEREALVDHVWDKNVPADFPGRDPLHPVQKPPLLPLNPKVNSPGAPRDGDCKRWSRDRDEKMDSTVPSSGRRPYFPEKNLSNPESRFSVDQGAFKGPKDLPLEQGLKKGSLMLGPKEPPSRGERQDQDYRDIDYRTGSGRKYDYILRDLQGPEKNVKESKSTPIERPSDSGSQVRKLP